MSDPLDDLRGLLQAVEPSRTFERDTRERIARERAKPSKPVWLFFVPIAAAAVVIVATVLRGGGAVGEVGDHSARREPAIETQKAIASVVRTDPQVHRKERGSAFRSSRKPVVFAIPENAHADQAIGVRRLMTLIRAGKANVPAGSMPFDENGVLPAVVLSPIEFKPIVIAPLPNGQGGGIER